jgi:hypothetical protein
MLPAEEEEDRKGRGWRRVDGRHRGRHHGSEEGKEGEEREEGEKGEEVRGID